MVRSFLSKIIKRLQLNRGGINRNDRFGAIHRAWGHIFSNHLTGDYVEFGVYKGDGVVSSLQNYAEFSAWLNSQKNSDESWRRDVANQSPLNTKPYFHCLDTFEGMPENNEDSLVYAKNHFISSLESCKKLLEKENKLGCEIRYYKGIFKNTKSEFQQSMNGRKIAIANIDCDLMESTVDALGIVESFIQIGAILLLDDYNAFNADANKGQRKAFADYIQKSNFIFEKFFTYHYSGQAYFVVGRK